jgi:methylmalonyl-CoA mutase
MQAVEHFAEADGRRPRILVVGFGAENSARAMAAGFAELGFDVDLAPRAQTPDAAARQAIENDVHVVGVSGDAAQVPAVVAALKDQGAEDILVVESGTDIPTLAAEILDLLQKRKNP